MSLLSSHASAITVCRTPTTLPLHILLGALQPYATIDLLVQISQGSMAYPSDAPASQVVEQRVKKKSACILLAKHFLWCMQRKLLVCTTYPTMYIE